MQMAGTSRTREVVRSATPNTPKTPKAPPPRNPSWGRVLATTISLWTARRVPWMRRPQLALVLAACMLIAAVAVVTTVQLTSAAVKTARTGSPGSLHQGAPRAGAPAAVPGSTAAVRAQAAAWVAGQVSSDQSIACDPVMCTALGAHGVTPGRLVPLGPETNASAANIVVTSLAGQAQASQDAPVLLASLGTGASQVEVRTTAPGGTAAYAKAQQADLTARRSGGTQLLHSKSIQAGAAASAQLQAGLVDSRVLIMLAMLASQHPWKVVAFGGSSPGVPLTDAPLRQVVISGPDDQAVAAALALVRAQQAPYAPAQASVIRLAGGQPGLRIDFAAPAPLGLLTGNASG
jgi:hypothetical protein